jgi:hypothetical protein
LRGYTYGRACTYAYIYVHACADARVCICMCAYACVFVRVYVCVCAHVEVATTVGWWGLQVNPVMGLACPAMMRCDKVSVVCACVCACVRVCVRVCACSQRVCERLTLSVKSLML